MGKSKASNEPTVAQGGVEKSDQFGIGQSEAEHAVVNRTSADGSDENGTKPVAPDRNSNPGHGKMLKGEKETGKKQYGGGGKLDTKKEGEKDGKTPPAGGDQSQGGHVIIPNSEDVPEDTSKPDYLENTYAGEPGEPNAEPHQPEIPARHDAYVIQEGDLINHPELQEQTSVGAEVEFGSLWVLKGDSAISAPTRKAWPEKISGDEFRGIRIGT